MAVHDEQPVIAPVGQERFAHPQHHLALLLLQRHARHDAGMHVEALPVGVRERQLGNPFQMRKRNFGRRHDAVAAQRGVATVVEPQRDVVALGGVEEQVLVVAHQADDAVGRGGLRLDQKIDHLFGALAAVDVVAEEDEAVRLAGAVIETMPVQIGQLGEAAVDIADRVGEGAGHRVPWFLVARLAYHVAEISAANRARASIGRAAAFCLKFHDALAWPSMPRNLFVPATGTGAAAAGAHMDRPSARREGDNA